MTPRIRTTVALAGVSLATGALAGCAGGAAAGAGAGDATGPASSGAGSSDTASSTAAASGGGSGAFKDGTYSARGEYISPGGPSAVQVTVTLKGDAVTAVKVVPKAANATAVGYEKQFASGVGEKVIGKKLTELNVTKVSGSSLTSQGFDRAIEDIGQQAKA